MLATTAPVIEGVVSDVGLAWQLASYEDTLQGWVYQLDPPLKRCKWVIVSPINGINRVGMVVQPATRHGSLRSPDNLPGTYEGYPDPYEALRIAGYVCVNSPTQFAFKASDNQEGATQ